MRTYAIFALLVAAMLLYTAPLAYAGPEGMLPSPIDDEPCEAILGKGRVMVALAFGQSNSANYSNHRFSSHGPVYVYHNRRCFRAYDPLPGASGRGGSVWIPLAERLIADGSYSAVVIMSIGYGGTSVAEWEPTGPMYPRLRDAITELTSRGIEPTHLLWHQGEKDARLRTRETEYIESFRAMMESVRAYGVRAPIYVSVASVCGSSLTNEEVRRAQKRLPSLLPDVLAGPDTDSLGQEFRFDGCHFNHLGIEAMADLWYRAIKQSRR